ncbi:MAG: twin-arginine translocation signal domain-containing protein [Terracidiphilus sp.]
MNPLTRRSFVTTAAAGLAALGVAAEAPRKAEAQLVWKGAQWKMAKFHELVENPASVKQVYDVSQIGGGGFLNSLKNLLNGLHFGFDVPEKEIKTVAGLHGPANMINYDDFIWNKYGVGAWLDVTDPETGKPAVRNIFYKSKHTIDTAAFKQDPDDEHSIYQDTSVEALQARGVQFLSCHTALEEQSRKLVKRENLSETPEQVVKELLAHKMPGVMVVASMVAAIALLQAQGHYGYLKV